MTAHDLLSIFVFCLSVGILMLILSAFPIKRRPRRQTFQPPRRRHRRTNGQ